MLRRLTLVIACGCASLYAYGADVGLARAQPASASLPDSTLEALKGRQVIITTPSGLSATGELAGFDAKSVTLIKTDSKIAIIPRTEITEIAIATAPAPAPPPALAPAPAAPAAGEPPTAAPASAGEAAAPSADAGGPVGLKPPLPWRLGVRSANQNLSDEEQSWHQASGLQEDHCEAGRDDPECQAALVLGAKAVRDGSGAAIALGATVLGIGAAAVATGAWQLSVASAAQDAYDICESVSRLSSACGSPGSHWLAGGLLTGIGGAMLVMGAVLLPVTVGNRSAAARFVEQHEVSIAPLVTTRVGSLTVRGVF